MFQIEHLQVMTQRDVNATPTLAKDYLSKRKIPELFEVNDLPQETHGEAQRSSPRP